MIPVTAEAVRQLIVAKFESRITERGLSPQHIAGDFDLLMEGLIDSLGILDLITSIEGHFQMKIDFDDLEPEYLTVVGPLCRYIEEMAAVKNQSREQGLG